MEDGSQFMRKGKQHFDDDVWNCASFYKVEINESIPDQQLSLQELRLRYQGEFTHPLTPGSSVIDGVNSFLLPADQWRFKVSCLF